MEASTSVITAGLARWTRARAPRRESAWSAAPRAPPTVAAGWAPRGCPPRRLIPSAAAASWQGCGSRPIPGCRQTLDFHQTLDFRRTLLVLLHRRRHRRRHRPASLDSPRPAPPGRPASAAPRRPAPARRPPASARGAPSPASCLRASPPATPRASRHSASPPPAPWTGCGAAQWPPSPTATYAMLAAS